jgi:hypothetical protein
VVLVESREDHEVGGALDSLADVLAADPPGD